MMEMIPPENEEKPYKNRHFECKKHFESGKPTKSAVWRHHWQCVIDGDSWSVEACLSIVRKQRFDLGLNFQDFDCIV
jgi:hypothetical protein